MSTQKYINKKKNYIQIFFYYLMLELTANTIKYN